MPDAPCTAPIIVGLTGTIGAGKSEAARCFRDRGAAVIDADDLARAAVEPGQPALADIAGAFGSAVVRDGALDRRALAAIVFSDPVARQRLEAIVHPRVRALFVERLAEVQRGRPPLIVYAVPLLFETANRHPEIAKTITVYAPRDVCIARAARRDGASVDQIEKRMAAQLDGEEKARRADFVIRNDGTIADLERAVGALFDRLVIPA